MKRIHKAILVLTLITCAACSSKDPVLRTLETAAKYMEEGDYAKAIESYSALISEDSDNAEYYVYRAEAYAASSSDEETLLTAAADYRKAIELDSLQPEYYLGLSDVYNQIGYSTLAISALYEGIRIVSDAESDETNIQQMEDKLEKLKSEYGYRNAEVSFSENLSLSDIIYAFDPTDTYDYELYIGSFQIIFCVEGPQDAQDVRIAAFKASIDDPAKTAAQWSEDMKKEPYDPIPTGDTPYYTDSFFPYTEEDLGRPVQVLLAALDMNKDLVGYVLITVHAGG